MRITRNRAVTASAITGGIVIGITAAACGGSSGPATASSVLQSDGYTIAVSESPAQITGTFGAAAPYASSAAAGTSASSGNVEVVVVFGKPGGEAILQQAQPVIQSQVSGTGLTESVSGDVLRISGPAGDFTSLGGGAQFP